MGEGEHRTERSVAEVRLRDGSWAAIGPDATVIGFDDDRNAAIRQACKMAELVALYSPLDEFKLYMPGTLGREDHE